MYKIKLSPINFYIINIDQWNLSIESPYKIIIDNI